MAVAIAIIANDSDLVVNPMPEGLDTTVSFIRVMKWDWPSKKGWAGGGAPVSLTNSTWFYDWNIGGTPTNDYHYALIRHGDVGLARMERYECQDKFKYTARLQ